MSRRRARVAIAMLGAWCTSMPAASAATGVFAASAGCSGTYTWTFSSPLTRTPGSGTVTETFDGVCWFGAAAAQVEPFVAGDLVYAVEYTATTSGVFSGTCDAAVVSVGPYNYVLAQSRLAVAASPATPFTYAAVIVFTPDQPCAGSSITGAGTTMLGAALVTT